MEQRQSSMRVAGIDVGKHRLDVAAHGLEDAVWVDNNAAGYSEVIAWLRAREVGRVGLEASGGYERGVRAALDEAGFEVVVHQPIEVRRFAQLKRRRAKNDRLDARLIAAATAQVEAVKAAQDPRLADLAERLTCYEQITDQAAELKTFLESVSLKDIARVVRAQIATQLVPHTFPSHLPGMPKPRVPFSPEIVERLWLGLEAGHGLRRLCREPGMPTRATVMRWLKEKPDFAEDIWLARWMGGLDGVGRSSGCKNGIGDRLFDRLAAGEPLRTICRDPDMPSRSTVHTWLRRHPDLADAIALARDLASWAHAERQWAEWGYEAVRDERRSTDR